MPTGLHLTVGSVELTPVTDADYNGIREVCDLTKADACKAS